jgi:beta-glucosidase-like glycosyl hydrolase
LGFCTCCRCNTNPANPIIGNRSFGSDINNVIAKGLAYAQGLQDNGVLASMKHFPGHGDTDKDSHLDLPVVSHNLERLIL